MASKPPGSIKRKVRALKRRKTLINDEDDFSEDFETEVLDEGMRPVILRSSLWRIASLHLDCL